MYTIPNGSGSGAVYQAMSEVYAADLQILAAASQGYGVVSGCAFTQTGVGTVAVAAGVCRFGTWTLVAITAANTPTINGQANASNPTWALYEVDSGGVLRLNVGTAAANPIMPTPTAGRVVLGAVYIPANATTVDFVVTDIATSGSTSANGNGKCVDKRMPILGPPSDGWITDSNTWTFGSATTFTISGDQTTIFTKGTRVSYNDGGVDYGTVASSSFSVATTTVTLMANDDYSIANATLTAPRYSYEANPQGYPAWFDFHTTVAPTGFSAAPSTAVIARFAPIGNVMHIVYNSGTNGTSNATTFTFTVPVAALQAVMFFIGLVVDNTVTKTTPGRGQTTAASTSCSLFIDVGGTAWTASGTKRAYQEFFYEF